VLVAVDQIVHLNVLWKHAQNKWMFQHMRVKKGGLIFKNPADTDTGTDAGVVADAGCSLQPAVAEGSLLCFYLHEPLGPEDGPSPLHSLSSFPPLLSNNVDES